MKNISKNKKAVSEVVGVILMLGMAIALFSIVHIAAMNFIPFTPNAPSVRISGERVSNTIYVCHNGGGPLPFDTRIIFSNVTTGTTINSSTVGSLLYKSNNNDRFWNIGEILSYTNSTSTFSHSNILMIIIDIKSNSVIAQDIFSGVN